MEPLCHLQNINLAFGQKVIFHEAKLTINEGDRIGLIGLNGQGKSTLFKVLTGEVAPDTCGTPFIFDKNKERFSLFYIPQELDTESYPELSVKNFYLSFYPKLYSLHDQLESIQQTLTKNYTDETLLDKQQELLDQFESLNGWEIENSYLSYLRTFRVNLQHQDIKKMSGGEQRKLALCIGLSSKENLILWDEPTNHLDIETIEQFEDELHNSSQTMMIISHDRYLLNNVSNKIIHIENGQINSFQGNYLDYLEYLEQKEQELAKQLDKLQNRHRRELAWMRQGVKARGTRSKKRVEGYHNLSSNIAELKAKSKRIIDINLEHSGRKSKQLIKIEQGHFSYQDKIIFQQLNLGVCKGDKIALIGPNGSGKTTLVNILREKHLLTQGVYKALDDLKVIVFDQKRETLDHTKTPFQVVGEGQDFVHFADGRKKHVMSYLEGYLFSRDQLNRPIHTLSGGEKNRLQLAMFMKQSADLWIFDEPTNDLDIETIEVLEQELKAYKAAVIIIGHDRAFLDNVCKTTWLVHNHHIEIFEGGHTQVAPYLQALKLEQKANETKNSSPSHQTTGPNLEKDKVKMTNKEKGRWKVIEDDISKQEAKVDRLKESLDTYDFSNTSQSYEKLHADFSSEQIILTELYNEWEILSEKDS